MQTTRPSFTSISVRVTPQERDMLSELAGKQTLSAYVRQRLLGDGAEPRTKQVRLVSADHTLLTQILAQLGASRMASNLNQIAKAIHMGEVILSSEQEAKIG